MKTLSLARFPEQKTNPFSKAAVLLALVGCNEASAPRPVTVVEVTAPPPVFAEQPRRTPSSVKEDGAVQTTMTLLKTGNTFLAYVSIPEGEAMRDLEDPRSAFYYSSGPVGWTVIPGCERTFSCDASEVISANPSGLRIKAEFSEPGYRPCASEPHPVETPAPSRP